MSAYTAQELITLSKPTLVSLIELAGENAFQPCDFLLVVVVLRSPWEHVARRLIPAFDWSTVENGLACGLVDAPSLLTVLDVAVPTITPELRKPPIDATTWRAVVFAEQGAYVAHVREKAGRTVS